MSTCRGQYSPCCCMRHEAHDLEALGALKVICIGLPEGSSPPDGLLLLKQAGPCHRKAMMSTNHCSLISTCPQDCTAEEGAPESNLPCSSSGWSSSRKPGQPQQSRLMCYPGQASQLMAHHQQLRLKHDPESTVAAQHGRPVSHLSSNAPKQHAASNTPPDPVQEASTEEMAVKGSAAACLGVQKLRIHQAIPDAACGWRHAA